MRAKLKQALIDKAKVSVGANNNMVQGPDSDHLSHFNQTPGYLDVLLTGSGITAGMVVNEENSGSRFPNRRTVDLPPRVVPPSKLEPE
jgi:hypothetical protein